MRIIYPSYFYLGETYHDKGRATTLLM